MSIPTNQKSMLDAKLVNPIINATMDVLGTMASTQAVLKELVPQMEFKPVGDISAVIGIVGDAGGEGMVAISFTEKLARLIVSRLLGCNPEDLSMEECKDGIGEVVNMISGNAKTILSKDSGTAYRLSLPTIISGAGHQIANGPKNHPYLVIMFETEGQLFALQVSFKG